MYEVELKVEASHEDVRERLEGLNAASIRYVEQIDTYYDAPHRDFAQTDEALRLRAERELDPDATDEPIGESSEGDGSAATVTYKGPLVEEASKTRAEHETTVADRGEFAEILSGLGFTPAATVKKRRQFFEVDGYTVTLDSVSGLGEFVEVEQEAAEADIATVRDGAIEVLESLGLDPEAGIRTSYLGLLLEAEHTN